MCVNTTCFRAECFTTYCMLQKVRLVGLFGDLEKFSLGLRSKNPRRESKAYLLLQNVCKLLIFAAKT